MCRWLSVLQVFCCGCCVVAEGHLSIIWRRMSVVVSTASSWSWLLIVYGVCLYVVRWVVVVVDAGGRGPC